LIFGSCPFQSRHQLVAIAITCISSHVGISQSRELLQTTKRLIAAGRQQVHGVRRERAAANDVVTTD
jgi:hypothetical protein